RATRSPSKTPGGAPSGPVLTRLVGKAAGAGKREEAVPAAYTSQEGSGGGERAEQSLAVRTPVCPNGGRMLDRDQNAARTRPERAKSAASNSLWRGQRLRGLGGLRGGMTRDPAGL